MKEKNELIAPRFGAHTKKGFSPATILFIAAAIAIVLIAFASFQIQASYLTPEAKIHSNELERDTRDAKLLTPVLTERASALAAIELGGMGGEPNNRSWYCNSFSPPNLTQLSLAFCDEGALIFSNYRNYSQPYCLNPILSNASLSGGAFDVIASGAELNLSTEQGTSYEPQLPPSTISGNRYWFLASNISQWFSEPGHDPGLAFEALLSKSCQARRCSCGSSAQIEQSTLDSMNITDEEAESILAGIATSLQASFNNSAISCSYEIGYIKTQNTFAFSNVTASGCTCANTQVSDTYNWAEMNANSTSYPNCTDLPVNIMPITHPRCGPFRTIAVLHTESSNPFLEEASREMGTLVRECSQENATCAFSQNIIFAPSEDISAETYSQLRNALLSGSVIITTNTTYQNLQTELGASESAPKNLSDDPGINARFFAFNGAGAILLPDPLPPNESWSLGYAELFSQIVDEITPQQPFLRLCPTSSAISLQLENTTNLTLANSTHSLAAVSRELQLSARITCTDSNTMLATKGGIVPLKFSVPINVAKSRDCPLPSPCESDSACEALITPP